MRPARFERAALPLLTLRWPIRGDGLPKRRSGLRVALLLSRACWAEYVRCAAQSGSSGGGGR